jgi:hypothetical protein
MGIKIAAINETKRKCNQFCRSPFLKVLMNKMLEETGKGNLLEIWPNLEVYFHGVNFEPYREQYQKNTP